MYLFCKLKWKFSFYILQYFCLAPFLFLCRCPPFIVFTIDIYIISLWISNETLENSSSMQFNGFIFVYFRRLSWNVKCYFSLLFHSIHIVRLCARRCPYTRFNEMTAKKAFKFASRLVVFSHLIPFLLLLLTHLLYSIQHTIFFFFSF